MTTLTIIIPGEPMPSLRARAAATRHGVRMYTDDRVTAAKARISAAVRAAWGPTRPPLPRDTAFSVEVDFVFERPKSVRRKHHTVKPDRDNLDKLVMDAITRALVNGLGGPWWDDCQVARGAVCKRYAKPGEAAHVRIVLSVVTDD